MKNILSLILFSLFPFAVFSQTIITRPGIGDCKLVFEDNFDSTALSTTKWNYRTDSKHWSTQLPANVTVDSGYLYLNVKKQKVGTMNYTGAGVISKRVFKYGYYESRFKIPRGKGWHTSFWMMHHTGSGGTGTTGAYQEIDVCENDSKNQYGYSTNLHNWNGTHTYSGAKGVTTPNLSAEFHTWGCEFTPTVVNYFFEGKLIRTVDASKQKHGDASIWLTTIASYLGGTDFVDTTLLPSAAIYDYVRFYELLNPVYPDTIVDSTRVYPNNANSQIIVDNTDSLACTFDSKWLESVYVPGYYGKNYAYSPKSGVAGYWAKWTPEIPAEGNYRIFMKWTEGTNRASAAPVEIFHAEGTQNITVDQTKNNGEWMYLGQFLMLKGKTNYVKISSGNGYTVADAVLFERQPDASTGLSNYAWGDKLLRISSGENGKTINTTISLDAQSTVSLRLYNPVGLLIRELLSNHFLSEGGHIFSFPSGDIGKGLRLAVLTVNGKQVVCKKIFIK